MSIDGFPFEGRNLTARALKREMPVYGVGSLQSALEAGMKTRADVTAYIERAAARTQARTNKAGAANYKYWNRKAGHSYGVR